MKNESEIPYNNILLTSHDVYSILEKIVHDDFDNSNNNNNNNNNKSSTLSQSKLFSENQTQISEELVLSVSPLLMLQEHVTEG